MAQADPPRRHRRKGPLAPGGARPADGVARPGGRRRRSRSSPPRTACRPSRPPLRRIPTGPTSGFARRSPARGVEQLYTHQAEAFEHVLGGRNVVTITPTASGKTLCYNAPVLERHPEGSVDARALSVSRRRRSRRISWPSCTRCRELVTRDTDVEIGVFTYDGDTPSDARRAIRGKAHVVLSNPDMVHSGILPHHPRWAKLFENLRFVDHRRAARLSRRVRQPPREHPAPPAARSAATTDRIRSSSARRRRSPIRASSPRV